MVSACVSLDSQQGLRWCSTPGMTYVPVQVEAPFTAIPQVKLWPLGGAAMAVFWRHTPPKKLLPCSSMHSRSQSEVGRCVHDATCRTSRHPVAGRQAASCMSAWQPNGVCTTFSGPESEEQNSMAGQCAAGQAETGKSRQHHAMYRQASNTFKLAPHPAELPQAAEELHIQSNVDGAAGYGPGCGHPSVTVQLAAGEM